MTLTDLLTRMDQLQERVVAMIYFEGRSAADTARTLSIDRASVGKALARAFRPIARWAMEEDDPTPEIPPLTPTPHVTV